MVGCWNTSATGTGRPSRPCSRVRTPGRGQRVAAEVEEARRRCRRGRGPAPRTRRGRSSVPSASAGATNGVGQFRPAALGRRQATGDRPCRSASAAAGRGRRTRPAACAPAIGRPGSAAVRRPAGGRRRAGRRSRRAACRPGVIRGRRRRPTRTFGCRHRAASTSPGSTRKPRILICSSARPRNSSTPSGRAADQVAGAVDACIPAVRRVGHESLGRQVRPVPVAAGQAVAAEQQFAGSPSDRLQAASTT